MVNPSTFLKKKKHGIQLMLMLQSTVLQTLLIKRKIKKLSNSNENMLKRKLKEHGMKPKKHGMKLKFGVLNF